MTTPPYNPDPFSTPEPAAHQPPQPDPAQPLPPEPYAQPPAPAPYAQQQYAQQQYAQQQYAQQQYAQQQYAQQQYAQQQQWQPIAVPQDKGVASLGPWAIVLTGLVTALSFVSALIAPETVEALKESLSTTNSRTSTALAPSDVVSVFALFAQIGAYLLLALWMWKLRIRQRNRGQDPGGVPAVEWWGWFVPLANAVLPALGMRALTRRTVSLGVLLGWWIPYVLSGAVSIAVGVITTFSSFDFETGEYRNLDQFDAMIPATWFTAVCVAISWVFLLIIIRTATAKEMSQQQQY